MRGCMRPLREPGNHYKVGDLDQGWRCNGRGIVTEGGMLFRRVERRLRRWLGLGWSAQEFVWRYAKKSEDAWGYLQSPGHAARADRILGAFAGWRATRLLEVGCAEGFLTKSLLMLADEVVACDLSEEAVSRAERWCAAGARCQFVACDVRRNLPEGPFDTCVLSDVLYYFSAGEIRSLAEQLHRLMPRPRRLVFANEWNAAYRDLTAPEVALECLTRDTGWVCIRQDLQEQDGGKAHLLAVLE